MRFCRTGPTTHMVLAVLCITAAGCAKETTVEIQPFVLPALIDEQRPTEVFGPESIAAEEKLPLVIVLHGYGANAAVQDQFIFKLQKQVDTERFILLLPDGTRSSSGSLFWNATQECCDFDKTGVDDVAFINELMDLAIRDLHADPARISLVGHSNGGYMAYRMACEHPQRLHRIVVLAGSVFINDADCKSRQPVSVLHIHGTHDNTVPYESHGTGSNEANIPDDGVATVGAEEAIKRWWTRAHCDPTPKQLADLDLIESLPAQQTGSTTDTSVLEWQGCDPDITVQLWRVIDGDHLFLDTLPAFQEGIRDFLFR